MLTTTTGRGPDGSPRATVLRWAASLAIATAALTAATSGVAAAAPAAPGEPAVITAPAKPLPACVQTRVTKGPGPRTTITLTNRCSTTVSYRIIWSPPFPSTPICQRLKPGAGVSQTRPGGGLPRAVACR